MGRKQPDSYYRRAKAEGFAARSVYKLEEMDRRYRLFAKGLKVLDLGCHPGSWMQFVSKRLGPSGLVLGVDIQPIGVALGGNRRFMQADILELVPEQFTEYAPFDLVISDAAPRTTGVAHADVLKSLVLVEKALDLAGSLLKPGGCFVAKAFFGAGTDEVIARVKKGFKMGKAHKPSASKSGSKEIYLVGVGYKG